VLRILYNESLQRCTLSAVLTMAQEGRPVYALSRPIATFLLRPVPSFGPKVISLTFLSLIVRGMIKQLRAGLRLGP